MEEKNINLCEYNYLKSNAINGWVPRQVLQSYLCLKNTAMSQFAQKYGVRTSKIGRLSFYYLEDINKLLDNNSKL